MNAELKYDEKHNLMYQTLHGDCSIRDLTQIFSDMEHLAPKPGLRILADITDANLHEANYDSVSFLEQRLDQFLDNLLPVRKAIIVESELEFGIARMYEMLAEKEGFEVHIFHDKEKALQWLDE